MRAPGNVIATLADCLPPLLVERALSTEASAPDLEIGIFLGDRDALGVEIEPRPGCTSASAGCSASPFRRRSDTAIGGQDMPRRRCVALRAQHEVVARRPPRRLLLHVDIRLCRAWRTGPCPWRRTAGRHRKSAMKPSLAPLTSGPPSCAEGAGGKIQLCGGEQCGGRAGGFQQLTAAEASRGELANALGHRSCRPFAALRNDLRLCARATRPSVAPSSAHANARRGNPRLAASANRMRNLAGRLQWRRLGTIQASCQGCRYKRSR